MCGNLLQLLSFSKKKKNIQGLRLHSVGAAILGLPNLNVCTHVTPLLKLSGSTVDSVSAWLFILAGSRGPETRGGAKWRAVLGTQQQLKR